MAQHDEGEKSTEVKGSQGEEHQGGQPQVVFHGTQKSTPVIARPLLAIVLLVFSAAYLVGGFVFLRSFSGFKVLAILFAIIWGLGSIVLLYSTLNMIAESLPKRARRIILPLVFAGPAMVLLIWFLVMPTLRTLWLSFFDSASQKFVGFANYGFAFSDRIMLEAFRNNLLWVVVGTFFCVGLGLVIAVLADRSRFEKLWKAIIFMPMAISFVGAGVIWKFIYAYKGTGYGLQEIGLLNGIVVGFGGQPQAWLQASGWNNFFLIAIMVWLQSGYAMVILSAAIKAIPAELIEAARIDGANEIQIFFRLIIPTISGAIITVTTTIVIFSLKLFDIVRVMTGGNFGTNVIANEFYIEQFSYGQTGRASSIAIVLLVAVIPIMIYNLKQFSVQKAFK